MPNRLTRGLGLFGDVKGPQGVKGEFLLRNTVARTDTVAKNLFTLPKDFVPSSIEVWGAAVSDAGTTATVSVGKSGGTGAEFLSAFDVKGATGNGQQFPSAALLIGTALVADTIVTGTYAETGTASTTGGPWTVIIRGTMS